MRLTLALFISFAASPALAHIGHIGEVAGHGHWIALGGIAIAAGIAALGARKKSDKAQAEEDAPEDDIEEEGAPA
ncbi:hypothetical protein Q4555_08255 [Octadecabacter sp. 1_MG-2023]|uniref:DUF6732 family protein n=1 Tax=unclassified Octadecabacter TaxID=196158 RepID=UPI001C0802AF|nr:MULTISPECIES: DUF6732 family protein [unclassified Octadecabacter]MBU2992584.1 hypothetical protein [Octadecabacter sp. B2R22]MDO6734659.1 hypothetical protein [Octadecabacter sp. 1_MG-2023]